jgi:hypothetical protein
MSSKASKPGGSAYNDKAAMAYCLIEILGIHTDALDNGSNKILRALIKSGCWRMLSWELVCIPTRPGPEYPGLQYESEDRENATWQVPGGLE